jgi:DNA-binding transcriptional ArsR family regulator
MASMIIEDYDGCQYRCSLDCVTMMTDGLHPATSELRLARILAALADPARLAAVQALARVHQSPCSRLYDEAGLTIGQSTFSHHQKVLREAGILHVRIHGSQRILSLRRDDLDTLFPGLLDAVIAAPAHLLGAR